MPGALIAADPPLSRAVRLRRFIEAYWLRPENALWMALRSEALSRCPWSQRGADISCGDGLFSFLTAGGELDPAFDVFCGVSPQLSSTADMFDHVEPDYRPPIITAPAYRVTVGTDIKPALLAKAATLGVYDTLVRLDNESQLPFADGLFGTIYCNAAYWVHRIDAFLGELCRICASDGRVICQVKTTAVFDYTLDRFRDRLGSHFLDTVDRGRRGSWPSVVTQPEWDRRFADAGLTIVGKTPVVTGTHAHIWDIGLRPLAPMLVKMAAALSPATRRTIKREWVDRVYDLLLPFFDPDLDLGTGARRPAEIQYELAPAAPSV